MFNTALERADAAQKLASETWQRDFDAAVTAQETVLLDQISDPAINPLRRHDALEMKAYTSLVATMPGRVIQRLVSRIERVSVVKGPLRFDTETCDIFLESMERDAKCWFNWIATEKFTTRRTKKKHKVRTQLAEFWLFEPDARVIGNRENPRFSVSADEFWSAITIPPDAALLEFIKGESAARVKKRAPQNAVERQHAHDLSTHEIRRLIADLLKPTPINLPEQPDVWQRVFRETKAELEQKQQQQPQQPLSFFGPPPPADPRITRDHREVPKGFTPGPSPHGFKDNPYTLDASRRASQAGKRRTSGGKGIGEPQSRKPRNSSSSSSNSEFLLDH